MSLKKYVAALAACSMLYFAAAVKAQEKLADGKTYAIEYSKPEKKPENNKFKLGGSFNSAIATDYVVKAGFVASKGPVIQNNLNLDVSNIFSNKDKLTLTYWSSYGLDGRKSNGQEVGGHELQETDLDIFYNFKISDSFSARISYQRWMFHFGPFSGKGIDVIEPGIHYSGIVEADVFADLAFRRKWIKSGQMYYGELSKPLKIIGSEKFFDITLTPRISAAYLNHYFQEQSSWAHITPGISANLSRGPFSIEAFAKKQFGFDTKIDKKYSGVSVNFNF